MTTVSGITIDSAETRLREQGLMLYGENDGSYRLELSVTNIADQLPIDSNEEAQAAESALKRGRLRKIFAVETRNQVMQGFATNVAIPALTFTLRFDAEANLQDWSLSHSCFRTTGCYTQEQFDREMNKADIGVQKAWRKIFTEIAPQSYRADTATVRLGQMAMDLTSITINDLSARYLHQNGQPALFAIARAADGFSQQVMTEVPVVLNTPDFRTFASISNAARAYMGLVNQRLITAHLDGEPPPYTPERLQAYADAYNHHQMKERETGVKTGKKTKSRLPKDMDAGYALIDKALHVQGYADDVASLVAMYPRLLTQESVLSALFNWRNQGTIMHRQLCRALDRCVSDLPRVPNSVLRRLEAYQPNDMVIAPCDPLLEMQRKFISLNA